MMLYDMSNVPIVERISSKKVVTNNLTYVRLGFIGEEVVY